MMILEVVMVRVVMVVVMVVTVVVVVMVMDVDINNDASVICRLVGYMSECVLFILNVETKGLECFEHSIGDRRS